MNKQYYCALCDFKITVECQHGGRWGIFHCKTCDGILDPHAPIIMNECCEVAYSQLIQDEPEAVKDE